jgi:hypothetical protein
MQAEPSKADPPKRKRRRFQFSLRSLLIGVTLFAVPCCYVAHEAKIVSERNEWLRAHSGELRLSSVRSSDITTVVPGDSNRAPSLIRRWLGDEPKESINVSKKLSRPELKEIIALFPEAAIFAFPTLD